MCACDLQCGIHVRTLWQELKGNDTCCNFERMFNNIGILSGFGALTTIAVPFAAIARVRVA